ncbi:thermonuclease family protein [Synechococcus sp. BA-132 BA5]|nr:thermonuclease family protein [Synechococcus sp. BA-132 BA5]MEA5416358.1 thermonuclease family protein [Synechococcus sp. BA-132 BA5]
MTLKTQTKDRYGWSVAEVVTQNGSNAGLSLIQQGNPFANRQHLKQCDEWAYVDREKFAERYRLGLWRAPGGIERPWPFWAARRRGQIRRAVVLQDYGVLGASSAATERLWMAMGMERACEALS